MADFPTLSESAALKGFAEAFAYDPSIRSQFENGTVLSRARFTSTKKKFTVTYNFLTAGDKTSLETLQETVMVGAEPFNWINPKDSVAYSVRLSEPFNFKLEPNDPDKWALTFTLVEA